LVHLTDTCHLLYLSSRGKGAPLRFPHDYPYM